MKKEEQFIILPVLIYLGRLQKFRFYIGIKKKTLSKTFLTLGQLQEFQYAARKNLFKTFPFFHTKISFQYGKIKSSGKNQFFAWHMLPTVDRINPYQSVEHELQKQHPNFTIHSHRARSIPSWTFTNLIVLSRAQKDALKKSSRQKAAAQTL